MKSGDVRKIGISRDPCERRKQVQSEIGRPVELEFFVSHEFVHQESVERAAHRSLLDKKVHGEWFSVSLEDAEKVVVSCLLSVTGDERKERLDLDFKEIKRELLEKADKDLEEAFERSSNMNVLYGPPMGMTATERLSAFLDWRYGKDTSKEIAARHFLSIGTMMRRFGDRVGKISSTRKLDCVTPAGLDRIFHDTRRW
jgi:hypothetical protein